MDNPETIHEVGNIYRWNHDEPSMYEYWQREYGPGPWLLTSNLNNRNRFKDITTGKVVTGWSLPTRWGRLDPFLTAAYKANHPNEQRA